VQQSFAGECGLVPTPFSTCGTRCRRNARAGGADYAICIGSRRRITRQVFALAAQPSQTNASKGL